MSSASTHIKSKYFMILFIEDSKIGETNLQEQKSEQRLPLRDSINLERARESL